MAHSTEIWIVVALVVIAAVVAGVVLTRVQQRRQSLRLRRRFGPEYERLMAERGDRAKTEAELHAREQRVRRLKILPLTTDDAARFSRDWRALQSRFVDVPRDVVIEAERLVRDLMVRRGYPMGDFEARAADISVDHPSVVGNYRAAYAIAVRGERGEASTEDLRKAVVFYRTLFDELLNVPGNQPKALGKDAMVRS